MEVIDASFSHPDTVDEIGQVDTIMLFDVLQRMVEPDWDQVLELYAPATSSFVITNPQWEGDTTVRLTDLTREEYAEAVPPWDAHRELFERLDDWHEGQERRYRTRTTSGSGESPTRISGRSWSKSASRWRGNGRSTQRQRRWASSTEPSRSPDRSNEPPLSRSAALLQRRRPARASRSPTSARPEPRPGRWNHGSTDDTPAVLECFRATCRRDYRRQPRGVRLLRSIPVDVAAT